MTRTARILTVTLTAASLLSGVGVHATAAPLPSLARTQTVAPSLATATDPIRVATYNIRKVTPGDERWSWENRRVALARAVAAAKPDVLLVQEASTKLWRGIKHVDDVRRQLRSVGYRIASLDYDRCTPGCTRGAHVFFDHSELTITQLPNPEVAVGMTGLSVIAGRWSTAIQDRAVSWAFLTPVGSSRATLYVSVHLPTQKTTVGESLRLAVAERLRSWADGLIRKSGLSSAEIVIGGDLNSFDRRQPRGAQTVLRADGLIDGFAAPTRVRPRYGTVNYTPATRMYDGFPPRPWLYRTIQPARVDYVFSTVSPLRHEVFLKLRPSGRFDNAFRASDHNMVLVDLPLR